MIDSNIVDLNKPVEDALNALLKRGAQQMLAKAVEAEPGAGGILCKLSTLRPACDPKAIR